MKEEILEDILSVVEKGVVALHEDPINPETLKALSNQTIHNASIFQDEGSVKIAVVMFAIYKLVSQKQNIKPLEKYLFNIRRYLKKHYINDFHKETNATLKYIAQVDKKARQYFNEVITHAQISKGYKIFDHGISLAKVAEILHVSHWELAGYAGEARPKYVMKDALSAKARLTYARKIFS